MKKDSKAAFTIVEALVVALISSVVLAGVYSSFIVGNRAWAHYNDSVTMKREVRRALLGMVNELREAENVRVIEGPEEKALHFYRPASGNVSYYWRSSGEEAGRIVRRGRLDSRILAQHISSLSFYHLKDAIVVDISARKLTAAGKETEISLREKVTLRAQTTKFRQ